MSELMKIGPICPTLTESEKAVVIASESPMLKTMEPIDLAEKLVNYINEALVILGHGKKLNETDVAIMSKLVTDKLQRKYPNYKVEEVWHAIRNGAFGEYDTTDGITYVSAKNIVYWCNCYQNKKSETLVKQLQYKQKLDDEKRKELEEVKRRKYWETLNQKIYSDYLALIDGAPLSVSAWVYYKSLEEVGIITVSKEEKLATFKKFKEEATKSCREKYERFIESDVREVARNKSRLFYYEKYLNSITNWAEEEAKIVEYIENSKLF